MRVQLGAVTVRIPIFGPAGEELRTAVEPPWPQWMRDLYGLEEHQDPGIDAVDGETTVPAALGALAERLHQRLELVAWVAGGLEGQGWTLHIEGDALLATTMTNPLHALEVLDAAGIAGALCAVAELNEDGWPRLYPGLATTA